MFYKIIFVLATVCVINASIITDNVFDDAVAEYNVEDSVPTRACNNQKCNQLCRKKKFRGGSCIGANCYCHKFLSLLEDTMNDLEESISLDDIFLGTEDEVSDESLPVSELAEDPTERRYNMQACDQLCHRLKFTGGACVNGRCKCDNFFETEDAVDEYSEFAPRHVCRITKCNRTCTRRGYEGATCVNGRCKCYNKTLAEDASPLNDVTSDENEESNVITNEDAVDEYSEFAPRRICRITKCNRTCTRRGYEGATCVNGRCKCYNKTQAEDASPLNDVTSDENEESNVITNEDAVDEYSEFAPRRVCRITKCNRTCTRRGYEGATCVNGRCKCYNKTQAEDVISETSLPVSELSEDQTERGCNMQACDQLCRSLKFPGGACVNGRCKCDNFFGTEVDAVDEYSELATRRICNLRRCNQTCTRRGYEGARCVNGRCKCYNKIQRQDASLLVDVTSYENEEYNVVLRSDEEEPIVPSSSECNILVCTQWCYHLKYDVGWCRRGRCQCYKN